MSLSAIALALSACDKKTAAAPAPPPPQVGFVTIKTQPVTRTIELPGRAEAVMTAAIEPQVTGVLLKRLFTEGSEVKAGQQLYQIDPSTYQATYDSDKATLAYDQASLVAARAKSARYRPLAQAQAVSGQDYDDAVAATKEAEAQILIAKAALEQASINLTYTKVLSPIDGHIGASTVTPGALVTANQTTALATVTQLDPIYIDVNEPATALLSLEAAAASGQIQMEPDGTAPVSIKLDDGSAYPIQGKLQFGEVTVSPTTGTVLLRALVANPNHILLPGMFVRGELTEGVDAKGILVPQQAVSHNTKGDPTVFLLDSSNKAHLTVIQTGDAVGANWIVTSGLKAGDRVAVDGLLSVSDNGAVTPVDETAKF
ncbi:efflux RND transporter periplasmic adaptor subunit [Acidisoma cellulosilyticum]|uniref:efflux RND transporter periplasmic adaptor subunit n=1 Tax=Acidisoma cellulosilyticum TaxID=2802395 RepID=UPI001D09A1B5|nr:efflux RND transporter periplasmic adaptor subunit [Acidisoma cellulosilyticum]